MRWMLHIRGSPSALDVVVGGFFPCNAQLPQGPEDLRHDVGRVRAHLGRKGFGVIKEVAGKRGFGELQHGSEHSAAVSLWNGHVSNVKGCQEGMAQEVQTPSLLPLSRCAMLN